MSGEESVAVGGVVSHGGGEEIGDVLAETVFKRSYARLLPDGRRETWAQAVDRSADFLTMRGLKMIERTGDIHAGDAIDEATLLREVVESHEARVLDAAVVAPPRGDHEVERRELIRQEDTRRNAPDFLARLAERGDQRFGALRTELARGTVVVDPHLARERHHDGEIKHLRERIAVGHDVVGARR